MLFKHYVNAFRGKNHTSKRKIDRIFKGKNEATSILDVKDISDLTFEKGLKYTKIQFNNKKYACYIKYDKANDNYMLASDNFESLIDSLIKVKDDNSNDKPNNLVYQIFSSDEVVTVDAYKKQLEALSNNHIEFTIAPESCKNLRVALQEFRSSSQSQKLSTEIDTEKELTPG
ncbi:hypothetical protein [Fangia hongkongensis]|uniref:hypothetical protein n=2 Tax=Fangia hongkongensis TaxID=270495 RepID=UPI0003683355|nr:hypothetical protein [Fangia hongkongensis]